MSCQLIEPRAYTPESRASLGGSPWLPQGQAWPACGQCNEPMTLFLQAEIKPEWQTGLLPGSQLTLFTCLKHSDPAMPPLEGRLEGQLPAAYWELKPSEREYCQYQLQLSRPETPLAAQPARPGLEPMSLSFTPHAENVETNARGVSRGEMLFKLGGVPSWAQDPEVYTCSCGAAMRFLCQIPADFEFERQDESPEQPNSYGGSYLLFLGNEVYLTACEAQCDPRALWPISQ